MADEKKIQLVIEALNKTKGAFTELDNQLKGLGSGAENAGRKHASVFDKLKANWIAISAVVAGAAIVINKALDLMAESAKAEQAESAFRSVAEAAGESADRIISEMNEAAAGTVDNSDIMQKALKGMVQGLSGNQLVEIMKVSRQAAIVSGQDVAQAYETITDAIGNNMPRALIQYGLITKEQMKLINAAMADGITEIDLYAFATANFREQQEKLTDVQKKHAEFLQQLAAYWKNLKENMGAALWSFINFASKVGPIFKALLSGSMQEFFSEIKKLDLSLTGTAEAGEIGAQKSKKSSGPSAKDLEAQLRARLGVRMKEAEIQRQILELEEQEKLRLVSHADAIRGRIALEEQLLARQEKSLAEINKDKNTQGWIQQQAAINETRRKITELNLALREQSDDILPGIQEGFERYLFDLKTAFQHGIELARQAAQAMESAFSDFFFDAMTGKLKKLGEYVKNFLQAVARAIANMLAQQAAAGILSGFGFGAGAASGGIGAGASAGVSVHTGGYIMHQGGYVPRFHVGGLSSDERPAVLQTGEYVVSRKGVAALDRINNGEAGGGINVQINVENRTSQPANAKVSGMQFNAQTKSYVIGVWLENFEGNGPVRDAVRQGGR